jgi:hypothetical protein
MRRRARVLGWFELASLGAFCALSACGGRSGAEFDDSWVDAGGASGSAGRGGSSSSTGGSGPVGGSATAGGSSGGRGGSASTGGSSSSGGAVTGGFAGNGGSTAFGGFAGFAGNGGTTGGLGGFGGSTGACVECITTSCPAAQECLADPACIEGAICGATSCVDQGSGVGCWLGCFGGDVQKALAAYEAVTCVVEGCGMQCSGAFGP